MYASYTLYFLLLLLFRFSPIMTTEAENDDDDCLVDINRDLSASEPLLLNTDSPPKFLYPDPNEPRTVRLDDNQQLRLVCGTDSLFVSCRDTKFYIDSLNGRRFRMRDIVCSKRSSRHMLKPLKAGCPSNVLCYQIGFQLNLFDFVPTIDLIYINEARLRPLWAHTTVLGIIAHRQKRGETEDYEVGKLFSGSISAEMKEIFDIDYQRSRFAEILGSEELAEKYITRKANNIFQTSKHYFMRGTTYEFILFLLNSVDSISIRRVSQDIKENEDGGEHLIRGQLIDNDDLFYKPQQDTVHYYANVVPIWRTIALLNWQLVSGLIHKLASDSRSNIEVWAGTMRTLELEDSKGVKKQIYMAYNTTSKMEVVPVPRLLFKYAYDRKHNRGVVIITVNDPYIKKLRPEHIICPEQELCQQLVRTFRFLELGYTYCCTLADFAKTAKLRGLPAFPNAQSIF